MGKISTTGMGKEHEQDIEKLLAWDNARRSKSSGSSFHDPIDITTNTYVIECEATDASSYRLKLDFWNEAKKKAHSNKMPALAIRFRDANTGKHTDLIVMSADDFSYEMESLDALRIEVLKRG